MSKKKKITIAFAIMLVLSVIGSAYAYFAVEFTIASSNARVETKSGLVMTLKDGVTQNINGVIDSTNNRFVTYFTIENEGQADQYARIMFKNIKNTYSRYLTYTLEEIEEIPDENTDYDDVDVVTTYKSEISVPSSITTSTKELSDGVLVKKSTTNNDGTITKNSQNYRLTFEYILLKDVKQNEDIDSELYTEFTMTTGEETEPTISLQSLIDEGYVYIEDGVLKNKTHSYQAMENITGKLIIDDRVTEIGDTALSGANITEVVLPNTITKIGDSAFRGCKNLKTIIIPETVTEIGDYAFYSNYRLKNVNIPEGVTKIGNSTFSGCNNISFLKIPSTVTSIGDYAFNGVKEIKYDGEYGTHADTWGALSRNATREDGFIFDSVEKTKLIGYDGAEKNITIPPTVKTIASYAFAYNDVIENVTIPSNVEVVGAYSFEYTPNLKTVTYDSNTKVTLIKESTFNSSGLNEIIIPNTITEIQSTAFYKCENLKKVTFEENSQLTTIGSSVFTGCTNLTEITIPSTVTTIGSYLFANCTSLEEITIPASVTTIGIQTFNDAYNIKKVTFEEDSQLTTIPSSFIYNTKVSSIKIPKNITKLDYSAFNNANELVKVEFEEGSKLTTINSGAFNEYNGKLNYVKLPDTVTSINNYSFSDNILVEYNGTAGTETSTFGGKARNPYIEGDFAYTDSTKETLIMYLGNDNIVTIPNTVKTISKKIFNNIIEKVIIPETVTEIDSYALYNTYIVTYNGTYGEPTDTWAAKTREYYEDGKFIYKDNTKKELILYKGTDAVVTILNSVTTIGNSAFRNNKTIKTVILPNNLEKIDDYAFYDSTLENVSLPHSLTYIGTSAFYKTNITSITIAAHMEKISDNAFADASLKKIVIEEGLKEIGNGAFQTTNIKKLTIPASVTSIGNVAFDSCQNLSLIKIKENSQLTEIGSSSFNNTKIKEITIPASVTSIRNWSFRSYFLHNVTFENKTGWSVKRAHSSDSPITIKEKDLENSENAAELLKSSYYQYDWTRSE